MMLAALRKISSKLKIWSNSEKYPLSYHPNITLTSAVYTILANVNEQLCYWTFNFRKVVRQQIWGEVVDFIPAVSAVHLRMQQWKNY